MNQPKSSAELKRLARGQLLGRYPTAVGALMLYFLIIMAISLLTTMAVDLTKTSGLIIYYAVVFITQVLCGVFRVGFAYLYLNIASGRRAGVLNLFYGFRSHADKAIIVCFLLTLVKYAALLPYYILNWKYAASGSSGVFLAACICLVAGYAVIIGVYLNFSQCYYIMLDLPQYGALATLGLSRQFMKGHKGRLFYIGISFVPICLLGVLSFGIGFLWLMPYMDAALANFYFDVVRMQQAEKTPDNPVEGQAEQAL